MFHWFFPTPGTEIPRPRARTPGRGQPEPPRSSQAPRTLVATGPSRPGLRPSSYREGGASLTERVSLVPLSGHLPQADPAISYCHAQNTFQGLSLLLLTFLGREVSASYDLVLLALNYVLVFSLDREPVERKAQKSQELESGLSVFVSPLRVSASSAGKWVQHCLLYRAPGMTGHCQGMWSTRRSV